MNWLSVLKVQPYFSDVYEVNNPEYVIHNINVQNSIVAVNIQENFSRQVAAGQTARIGIISDGRKTNSSQIVNGYLNEIIFNYNNDMMQQTNMNSSVSAITVPRAWFNPNLIYLFYNLPCLIGVLSMIVAITVSGLSVAREREMGTFDQLLISPLSTWELLIGKAIPALLISIGESTIILIIALVTFKVPFQGSIILYYISMVVFISAIIGVGLFISSLTKTQQQATLGAFIFIVPTMLLSGYATPVENMLWWLKPISFIIPNTHFFIISKGIFLKDMGTAEVAMHLWPIILIGAFNLLLAGSIFAKEVNQIRLLL